MCKLHTLLSNNALASFLVLASARCFCSTSNLAAVALSMSLALKRIQIATNYKHYLKQLPNI